MRRGECGWRVFEEDGADFIQKMGNSGVCGFSRNEKRIDAVVMIDVRKEQVLIWNIMRKKSRLFAEKG